MITYRRELYFECDGIGEYNPDCSSNLCLDQMDAYTKRGMLSEAKRIGWTWDKEHSWCPSCSKKRTVKGEKEKK